MKSRIPQKKKTCKACGKERYIFSKGRCKECSNKEYAAKRQAKLKEKMSSGKTKKPKTVTKRHKEAKDAERVAMRAFWETKRDVQGFAYCAECGCNLGGEFNPYNVAHIISKGSNPAFRCDMRNFILLCADHHNEFDGGKRTEMKVYERTEEIRDKLRNEDSKKL
jgi:hypothetical protein